MGKMTLNDEVKRDAVAQITERDIRSRRFPSASASASILCIAWKRQFAKVASGDASKNAEIRQLKHELARMTDEREILKKRPRI